MEASPPAAKFAWSFFGLRELAKLAAKPQWQAGGQSLALGALKQLEGELEHQAGGRLLPPSPTPNRSLVQVQFNTSSSRLSAEELEDKLGGEKPIGLLLCNALNSLGWQRRPCASLALPPPAGKLRSQFRATT